MVNSPRGSPPKNGIYQAVFHSPAVISLVCFSVVLVALLTIQNTNLSAKLENALDEKMLIMLTNQEEERTLAEIAKALEMENDILQQKVKQLANKLDTQNWKDKVALTSYNFSHPVHRIHSGDPNSWSQRTFIPHGHYAFVQFSAYRLGSKRIGVTGMVYTRVMKFLDIKGCVWKPEKGDSIQGSLFYEIDVSTAYNYTGLIMWCDLKQPTGNGGGHLLGLINDEEVVLFREAPDSIQEPPPPKYQLSYCSAPLYGLAHTENVKLWFDYHRKYTGIEYFVLYNVSSVDEDLVHALSDYQKDGALEIVNMGDVASFNFHLFGQVIALNDCVFSMVFQTKWLFLHDLDEFLWAVPPNTMFGLLKQYSDKSWLSHGSYKWDVARCLDSNSTESGNNVTMLERMVFRSPKIVCDEPIMPREGEEMCLHWTGHRKLILQPRKVIFTHVHEVRHYGGRGFNLNARTELVHHHYRGLNARNGRKKCQRLFPNNTTDGSVVDGGRWRADYLMSSMISQSLHLSSS